MSHLAFTLPLADPLPDHRISLPEIVRAQTVIDPVFLNSPQYDCEPLSAALGCQLTLKVETINPIRSFKGRGADFLISNLKARPSTQSSINPPIVTNSVRPVLSITRVGSSPATLIITIW